MGVEINRFSRNPSFTFSISFLLIWVISSQLFINPDLWYMLNFTRVSTTKNSVYFDDGFLIAATLRLFMTNFVHQHFLENFPLFRLSIFESTTDINVKQYGHWHIFEINQFDVVVKLFKTISLECTSWRLKRRASKTFEGFKTHPLLCVLNII